jgi:integrase/recombinase XerD
MSNKISDLESIALWLNNHASPLTRDCYGRDAERLLAHVHKPLNRITLGDLQSFEQSLVAAGLAPISRARTIAAIKSLFGFCQRLRHISTNPAAELALPHYENRLAERVLSEGDVQRLLTAEGEPRDRILLNLLYFAGLRVSEACGLRWRNLHVRRDAGQVTVFGKNGKTRAIPLPAAVWSDLAGLRAEAGPEDPVFPSRSGRPLDRGRVRTILHQAARRAGVDAPASPHWLRHAHASHALDHGAPIHLVQTTLGHSSVATTSTYLHARPDDSSARFLYVGTSLAKSGKSALPLQRTRVMDVMTAATAAKGDVIMTSNTEEQARNQATATAPEQKATKKANTAPRKPRVAPAKAKAGKKATPAKNAPKAKKAAKAQESGGPREGSKTAQVVAMLQRKNGATLPEIMEKMGWLRHTVRGFMAGAMKKAGFIVESFKPEGGERTYRINK